jgi:two-component system nitrogen regulation sensor histidine kinase GlnL
VRPGPDAADIIAVLPTAILLVAPDGRVARVNAAAEAAINMSAASLSGRPISDILVLPPGFDVASDAPFAAFDVDLQTRRGIRLHGDFLVAPFGDWKGWRLVALHASAAAYRMGHRLENQGRARSAIGIAAMLAHEIKNPLSGIRGASQLLEARAAEADARLTRLIRSEVDRITALIDQMEGFTDTRPLTLQPANIHEIIDHARQVALTGFGKDLKIVESYDPSLPPVMVHRDSLIQILINLLKNAAETSDKKEVRLVKITTAYRHGVSIAPGGRGGKRPLPIELCVIDDGPGAPPELVDSLFDPFVTSKHAGKGLGLALADKLIRDMGGIIQYERQGTPAMTVFRLLLPRAEGVSA